MLPVFDSIACAALPGPTYLTIGNFDGVHRGHRALMSAMSAEAHAHGAACGLLTFYPHPRSVLRPDQPISTLTSLAERLSLLPEEFLDFAVVQPFTPEIAQTEAEEFLRRLHSHLGLAQLWVGPDFALGRQRRGTVPVLRELAATLGIGVTVSPEFTWEEQPVRSSRVRRLLEIGNVEWIAPWLGRFYALSGVVVHGAERGRSIGFPTANLSCGQGRVIPANGVYATWAWVGGKRHPSVTNIGVRPTVNGSPRTVEAHLIDFDGGLYGRSMELQFVYRLRDEVKFPGLDALKAQIARDRDQAAALLSQEPQIPATPRFEEIPHTADWAVRVHGRSQADLFANAAIAMASLQGAAEIDGPTLRQHIAVEASDAEDLLVGWLSQLLWHADTQGISFQSFHIESITATTLQALAIARRGRSEMAHIKAVTYHDLSVTAPVPGGSDDWSAQVLFDT